MTTLYKITGPEGQSIHGGKGFWSRVAIGDERDCWPWLGTIAANGYGRAWLDHTHRRAAHRVAYELAVGPIPDGLFIDHLCRNRACVNPSHLEPVTHRENIIRGETLPAANVRKRACPAGHLYDEANTRVGPEGDRKCRRCNAIWQRARRARDRAA